MGDLRYEESETRMATETTEWPWVHILNDPRKCMYMWSFPDFGVLNGIPKCQNFGFVYGWLHFVKWPPITKFYW